MWHYDLRNGFHLFCTYCVKQCRWSEGANAVIKMAREPWVPEPWHRLQIIQLWDYCNICMAMFSVRPSTSCRKATSTFCWRRSRWRRKWGASGRWSVAPSRAKRSFHTLTDNCPDVMAVSYKLLGLFFCLQCNYTYFKPADRCVEQNHDLRWHDALKRFFKCSCGQRAIALDRLPNKHCR